MDTCILVAIAEIEQGVDNTQSIEDRLRAAMKKAKNHWLVTNEDDQFKAAIGAVLVTATEEEQERIKAELDVIKAMNAAMTGVPVDFAAIKMDENPIGIVRLWQEKEHD